MCGICGIIGELDNSRKVLKNMMDKIAHRGPDDEGMYVDKHEMCIRDRVYTDHIDLRHLLIWRGLNHYLQSELPNLCKGKNEKTGLPQ